MVSIYTVKYSYSSEMKYSFDVCFFFKKKISKTKSWQLLNILRFYVALQKQKKTPKQCIYVVHAYLNFFLKIYRKRSTYLYDYVLLLYFNFEVLIRLTSLNMYNTFGKS